MAVEGKVQRAGERPQGRTLTEFAALRPAEQRLLEAARIGAIAKITDNLPQQKSDQNCVRPEFLRFLALGGDESAPVHSRGVLVYGAWIDGNIDFECCRIVCQVALLKCCVAGAIYMRSADTQNLIFDGTMLRGINGDNLRCRGNLHFRNDFHSIGPIRLSGARVRGELDCSAGRFEMPTGVALNCEQIEVDRIFLRSAFTAAGEVSLIGARVAGNLDCDKGRFEVPTGMALNCEGAEIGGSAFMGELQAKGTVSLATARIGSNLQCNKSAFDGLGGRAIFCDNIKVEGSAFFSDDFRATGEVRMVGARIGSDLSFEGARFETASGYALNCNRARIDGGLHFRGVVAPDAHKAGVVGFLGAHATVLTDDAASWQTASELVLDGFTYDRIAGVPRTNQTGTTVANDVPPRDAETRIAWLERQVRRHLEQDFRPQPWQQLARVLMEMGHDDDARAVLIRMRKRQRDGRWKYYGDRCERRWWFLRTRFDWVLGLLVAYGYRPHRAMWTLIGLWIVGGLIYSGVAAAGIMAPTDAEVYLNEHLPAECRIDWIGFTGPTLPTRKDISRAPDENARASLQKQISDDAARRKDMAIRVGLDTAQDWNWKAICNRAMPSEYSAFQPLAYSVDLVLPFLELRQEHEFAPRVLDDKGNVLNPLFTVPVWLPFVGGTWGVGYLVRVWEWFEIFFGWTLTILIAASVSGIIKKD